MSEKCGDSSKYEDCCNKGKCSRDLYECYKDAVVRVMSEFSLTASGYTTGAPPGDLASYFLSGNGFMVKKHLVVCPAHLVLIPPTVLSTNNRYPYTATNVVAPTGTTPNAITQVSRILVDVFNVNGCCRSYTYQASLHGVDGAGDIAVLKLEKRLDWNLANPCIECKHPWFKWGKSRAYCAGEPVYAIGDFTTSRFNLFAPHGKPGIIEGTLADNRYMDYQGWALPEFVLTDLNAYFARSGLPLLDKWGRIIGMQTTNVTGALSTTVSLNGDGYVAGPSQFFMKKVVKSLLCGRKSRFSCELIEVTDLIGNFYKFKKGYLGVYYNVFTGLGYDTSVSTTTGVVTEFFDPTTGAYLQGPTCKEVAGVRVVAIAGNTGTSAFALVPGTPALTGYPTLQNSPLLGTVSVNDVITHIGKCALGNIGTQIPPSLITWRAGTKDPLDIRYRTVSDRYESFLKTEVTPIEFPPLMDFPWYKIADYPTVAAPNSPIGPVVPMIPSAAFKPAV